VEDSTFHLTDVCSLCLADV